MAFNATAKSSEYHYLVEFLLDSTTLRFADSDISIQHSNTTGYFYEGRLPESGTLSRSLSSFIEPKETLQSFDVKLDNTDEKIQEYIDSFTFANRNVNIWLGEGESKNDYSIVFPGFVAHPAGVEWDEDSAKITVIDRRLKDRRILPEKDFTALDFPNLQRNASGLSIPIIYGDYSSAAANAISVQAYCISTTAANARFKVAGHRINSLDRVLQNGLVTAYQNVSLEDATFELVGSYNFTNDLITANVKGYETSNGTLIETPQDVLKNVLTVDLSVDVENLNLTAFDLLDSSVTEPVRRVINVDTTSEVLISELINESAIELRFVDGKYSPVFRLITDKSSSFDVYDSDIVLEDVDRDKADIVFRRDTQRTFTNKIRASYNFDPVFGTYLGDYEKTVTASTEEVSSTIERPMTFNWLYEKDTVEARVQRELIQYSNKPTEVEVTISHKGLQKNLADVFSLNYNIFDDIPFQIRGMETDLSSMTTRIYGFGLAELKVGLWTDDTVPSYVSASDAEIASSGWWSTDLGYIVSGNSTTLNQSLWF